VITSFHEPAPAVRARLGEFTLHDWLRAKCWLDVSGLALYFLDRLIALNLETCIPTPFLNQLRTNLTENRKRADSLFDEILLLASAMQQRNINCCVLKGVTLPPQSVPDIALRNQSDLDVLVRESDAESTKECLAEFGYRLTAVSGSTWEFKAGPSGTSSLRNLYQVRPERAVDVQLIAGSDAVSTSDRLTRAQLQCIGGHNLPALSPADIFVMQGQHLFKHICSEFTRVSWLLEYWRHVCARRNDAAFWEKVQGIAARENGADVAIGATTLLASLFFGPFAPQELSRWSTDRLPPAVCLWIQLYGRRVLMSDTPFSKLYLLLRKELNGNSPEEYVARRRLIFPLHRPPRITHATGNEGVRTRLRRYRVEAQFLIHRIRFHLAEGISLAIESLRWQRRLGGVSQ
jgi:hypothetical protein